MPRINFKITKFKNIKSLIADFSFDDPGTFFSKSKGHLGYLEEYFDYWIPCTVIEESEYVDLDFLDDFAGYYSKCFRGQDRGYKRYCKRFHFFSNQFTRADFIGLHLKGKDSEYFTPKSFRNILQTSYLGFIVIKPLPQIIIGRTCLKPYKHEERRYYPVTRKNKVNLMGMELWVDSLAYQEQDRVVAACATSALWTCFQGTAHIFGHTIPKPIEISNSTGKSAVGNKRLLPSSGLTPPQIAHVIKSVGLEPEVYLINSPEYFAAICYAYMRAHIPVLGAFEVHEIEGVKNQNGKYVPKLLSTEGLVANNIDKNHKRVVRSKSIRGLHAVAMTGYSLPRSVASNGENSAILRLQAYGVNKLRSGPRKLDSGK